ncbi:hypothetical protein [Embleya sp. AB8]|uniref:hypothetical protein n=1 Tax=Embleya sp. AB8 TaxID=3156304 RepID=UPI003C7277D6
MAPEAPHTAAETTHEPDATFAPVFVADACSTTFLAHGSRLWLFEDRLVYVDVPFASRRGFRTVLATRQPPLAILAWKRQRRDHDAYRLGAAYRFTPQEWSDHLAGQGPARILDIPWTSIAHSRIKVGWSGETRLRLEFRDGNKLVIKWRTGCGADSLLREVLPGQVA